VDACEAAEQKAGAIAEQYGSTTGGSDFHGFYGETDRFTLGSKNLGMDSVRQLAVRAKVTL
jgi:hypothetical protein